MGTAAPRSPAVAGDVLTVHLDGRPCAVPLSLVLDVCRTIPVTALPGAPAHVVGMGAWRGRVIPCISLHRPSAVPVRTVPRQWLMVVLRLPDGEVALAVEEPVEVVSSSSPAGPAEAGDQPTTAAGRPTPAAATPMLLDLERLLPRYPIAARGHATDAKRPSAP